MNSRLGTRSSRHRVKSAGSGWSTRAATPRRRIGSTRRGGGAPTRMRGLPTTRRPVSVQAELGGSGPGEFVADELALLMLRDQPYQVRCLIARSRRTRHRYADRVGGVSGAASWTPSRSGSSIGSRRRVTEATTLAALDEQAVAAAQTRSPKQLQVWLLRLVVQLEPLAFQQRHGRALAERRVTVVQGADGIGYVTGEVSAADAGAIDATVGRLRSQAWALTIRAPSSNAALTCSPTCSSAASPSIDPTVTRRGRGRLETM